MAAGQLVAVMPQGTIPRGPAFFEPELKGRWGAAKLAQMTKAPVIPVGIWGSEKVWPRSSRLPNVAPRRRPKVRVKVGSPVPLGYADVEAAAAHEDPVRRIDSDVKLDDARARGRDGRAVIGARAPQCSDDPGRRVAVNDIDAGRAAAIEHGFADGGSSAVVTATMPLAALEDSTLALREQTAGAVEPEPLGTAILYRPTPSTGTSSA